MRFIVLAVAGFAACAPPATPATPARDARPREGDAGSAPRGPVAKVERARAERDEIPVAKPKPAPPFEIAGDFHIALDAAEAPPRPVCTLRGAGAPFQGPCVTTSMTLSADREGKVPIAIVGTARVDVRFELAPASPVAWATIDQGKALVTGFAQLEKETFRLTRDAVAFGGHVHLKANAPVTIRQVGLSELSVATRGDTVNIEDIVASARCDGLSYDPFQEKERGGTFDDGHADAIPRGETLHLSAAPGALPFFTLASANEGSLYVELTIADRVRDERRVVFSTERARFDAWVPASEIVEPPNAGHGYGLGSFCGGASDGFELTTVRVARDVDVLVAASPSAHGPRGVRLKRGARVRAWGEKAGWSEIAFVDAPIGPPAGASFWVPSAVLRSDPGPHP